MHSFTDYNGKIWTACCECNRGGNGNDKDKCSCGWQCTEWNELGCFLGVAIVGEQASSVPAERGLTCTLTGFSLQTIREMVEDKYGALVWEKVGKKVICSPTSTGNIVIE
jgi:hypothetical protein